MATSDTGALGTLTLISVTAISPDVSDTEWLRVRFSLDSTGATDTLTGFTIWHDNEDGTSTPVWVDACNCYLVGGGDNGSPVRIYESLVPVPLATIGAIHWETFSEYPDGAVSGSAMDKGGLKWSGPWALDHTITTRSAGGYTTKRCVVEQSEPLGRTLAAGSSWTDILIGVRFGFNGPDSVNPANNTFIGLCSGLLGLPTSGSTINHFLGLRTSSGYLAYQAPYKVYWYQQMDLYSIISGAATASGNPDYVNFTKVTDGCGAIFMRITKGSPNWTIKTWYANQNSGAVYSGNLTRVRFDELMRAGDLTGLDGVVTHRTYTFAAPDEGTNGALDSVVFAYDSTVENIEVADFRVEVL